MKQVNFLVSLCFLMFIMLAPNGLSAQKLDGLRDINVLTFQPVGSLGSFISTVDPFTAPKWSVNVGLGLWYANGLLKVHGSNSSYSAVEHQVGGTLMFNIALPGPSFLMNRSMELGLSMPMAFWQGDKGSMQAASLKSFAWGDPLIYLKGIFIHTKHFKLGLKPFAYLGVGRKHANASSGWSGGASLVTGVNVGRKFHWGVEAGFIYRKRVSSENLRQGKAVLLSMGMDYAFLPYLALVGDVWGETTLEGNFNAKEVPLEGDLGLRFTQRFGAEAIRFMVGAGTGFGTHGAANPDYRVFMTLQWAHLGKVPVKTTDRDGDGIRDKADKCPDVPEDRDGFEDSDGCPDIDNDKDGILDKDDKCPNQAEDKDGFEDTDGCPDIDNDKDGILDKDDKCPNQAEDKDGFEDTDGCPDIDNDKDGILDKDDKCPNAPETINGYKDTDGCPDKGKSLVRLTNEKIEILKKVYFYFNKAKIKPESFKVLVQVATILKLHKNIKKLEIQGHTDTLGRPGYNLELSRKRANAVRDFLISTGVEPDRLVAKGYGATKPVADCSGIKALRQRRKCEGQNRRVEFVILQQDGVNPSVKDSKGSK